MTQRPPRYVVDYESVARTSNPLEVIELLVDRTAAPNFWRDSWCIRCEHWASEKGEERPVRPYAPNPLDGCAGCVLSHLDESPAYVAEQEERKKQRASRPRQVVRPQTLVEFYHQRKGA